MGWNTINVSDVCSRASILAIEFLEFGGIKNIILHMPVAREAIHGCPPIYGSYKVSITCHFRTDSEHAGVGILIRDHDGLAAVALGFVLRRFNDCLINYSFPVYYALQLAYEAGFCHNIMLEVPSKELIGLLHIETPCLAPLGVLIYDIRA